MFVISRELSLFKSLCAHSHNSQRNPALWEEGLCDVLGYTVQDDLELLDQKFPSKSEIRSMKFHRIPTLKRSVGTGRREHW